MKKSMLICGVTMSVILSAAIMSACASSTKESAPPAVSGTAASSEDASGEGESPNTEEQKEVSLQYSTTSTPGTVYVQAFQRMADEVEEKTGGKVHVVIYDSSQLGNESDVDTNVLRS